MRENGTRGREKKGKPRGEKRRRRWWRVRKERKKNGVRKENGTGQEAEKENSKKYRKKKIKN